MTTIMMMICNDNYNNGDVDDNDKQPVKHHRDELPILLDFVRLLLLFGQLSHISGYKYQIHVDFNISKYVNIILLEPQYTTIYLGTNIVLFGLQYITIYLGLNIILFGYYLNIWLATRGTISFYLGFNIFTYFWVQISYNLDFNILAFI